jgi:hypothetical protein
MAVVAKVSLSSGAAFPEHSPRHLLYTMSFQNHADYLILEAGFWEPLNIKPNDEVIFDITPTSGDKFKFVGLLYDVKPGADQRNLRLTFISKYYMKLMSMPPLFGKGNAVDIAKAFYAKAGVPILNADTSNMSFDNIVLPRTATIADGLLYVLNRATTPNDSYLAYTLIGDTAYIRDIKKPRTPYKELQYTISAVKDNRKKIDVDGGLSTTVFSDAEEGRSDFIKLPGQSIVQTNDFYTVDDYAVSKARSSVQQAKVYYTNYVAYLSFPGFVPLMANFYQIGPKDIYYDLPMNMPFLMAGKYFCSVESLHVDFNRQMEVSQCALQYVAES